MYYLFIFILLKTHNFNCQLQDNKMKRYYYNYILNTFWENLKEYYSDFFKTPLPNLTTPYILKFFIHDSY